MIAAPEKVVFGAEYIKDVWEESLPLIKEHYDEIEENKDIPLDPDFELYKKLDDLNVLRVFTARENDKLVGYCVYTVQHSLQSKTSLQAHQNILFISKKRRGFGRKFLSYCDDMLKREGIQVIHHSVSLAHNYGILLEKMGYKAAYTIYARRLI